MRQGKAKVVVATTESVIDVRGESFEPAGLAGRLTFDGLALIGSDFAPEYTLARKSDVTNSQPVPLRTGMVR
eukprot:gene2754-9943_t